VCFLCSRSCIERPGGWTIFHSVACGVCIASWLLFCLVVLYGFFGTCVVVRLERVLACVSGQG